MSAAPAEQVCANAETEVRQILVLPASTSPRLHDNIGEQLKSFNEFLETKLSEYKEVVDQNSAAVFAVNYIQNRFIVSEFCVELAKLFEILSIKSKTDFKPTLDALKKETDTESLIEQFDVLHARWERFITDIDIELNNKLGSNMSHLESDEEIDELSVQSKTISHYVNGSAFEMVLVVVVRSFNSAEVNQHILGLYNKMDELHKLGCDVYLLTRGPPIGTRGGAYIKLIGVPFRKLYDEEEAIKELKVHRRSAERLAGWSALLKTVELALSEEKSDGLENRMQRRPSNMSNNDEQAAYITQKGGTILVDKSGNMLFKYIEDENVPWPNVESILNEVKKHAALPNMPKVPLVPPAKVDSEVSAIKGVVMVDKQRTCCVLL